MTRRFLAAVILCGGCSGQMPFPLADTDEPEEEVPCDSLMALQFPGGASSTIPCRGISVGAKMEFDPDDPPEIRTMTVEIDGSSEAGFDCSVTFAIRGVCGPGRYYIADMVRLSAVTYDCAGTPDAFEGELTATGGFIEFAELGSLDLTGNFAGQRVPVEALGEMDVSFREDVQLTGAFRFDVYVSAEDAEEQTCANTGPVQLDTLTSGALTGTWSNGNDAGTYSYDLGLGGGLPPVGCPECTAVGNLSFRNLTGETFTDRLGETVGFGVNATSGVAYELDPISDRWNAWGSGTIQGKTWSGTRPFNLGGAVGEEALTLSW